MNKANLSDAALATLTPREEKVMKMYRDGIAKEDIAIHFNLDFERIEYIWQKACRKLRHESRQGL
jgi:DNA-directed RNA polymerase sigma subunit (sigma70/sigma32)